MGEGQLEVAQVGEKAVAVLRLLEKEVVGVEGRGEDERDGLKEGLSCFEVPVEGVSVCESDRIKDERNTYMVLHAKNSGRNGGSSSLGCLWLPRPVSGSHRLCTASWHFQCLPQLSRSTQASKNQRGGGAVGRLP